MRPADKKYDIDAEDFPHLRARPTWVSADENVDNIQNEINVYSDGQKLIHSLGRSMKRDIQIKLKAVSADHSSIAYTGEKGWTITERGKDRLSSNGTFIFMKSMQQMNDHVPSDMIPLHDEMIISFVNYELKVSLLQKTAEEVKDQQAQMNDFFAKLGQSAPAAAPIKSTPSGAGSALVEEPKYTAEVQPNAAPSEAEQPAASEAPKEEESKQADAVPTQEEAKPDADGNGEAMEPATEAEMANAATKISAVYKGNKDRERVRDLKAARESATPEDAQPAESDANAKAEEGTDAAAN